MTQFHAIGPYRVSDTVLSAVHDASARTGVDFRYMMAKAATESAFNPTVRAATSNATGLYQFINSTWLAMIHNHGRTYGLDRYADMTVERPDGVVVVPDPAQRREILNLRNDPRISAYMAAEYALENQRHLERTVGGPIGATELYLGHFLGAHGASRFLNALHSDPRQIGAALFPAAAAANGPAFYAGGRALSVREIYDLFDRRVSRDMALVDGAPADLPTMAPPAEPTQIAGPSFFLRNPVNPSFFAGPDNAPAQFAEASVLRGGYGPSVAANATAAAPAPAGGRSLSLWTVLTASTTRPA